MKLALFTFLLLIHSSAFGNTYTFSPENGAVEFHAKGTPSLLKITGKGSGPSGVLTKKGNALTGSLAFQLQTLDTGIELRNEHMKNKYLEVQTFPTATLYLPAQTIPDGLGTFDFSGELEVKGVKKPVKGTATVKGSGTTLDVSAEFAMKLTDYPIGVPTYLGITVAENVKVAVTATVVEAHDVATK